MRLKTKDVARASGVNEKTLHYWDQIGLVRPSVAKAKGRGTVKLYSFGDTVAAAAAHRLRRVGIYGDAVKRVVGYVRRRTKLNDVEPQTLVVLDGRRVLEYASAPCDAPPDITRYGVALNLYDVVQDVQEKLKQD